MQMNNGLSCRNTANESERVYRVKPTIIVGRLTVKDRLPANLMFSAYRSTIVGIKSSPPATPNNAATTPIPNPATRPITTRIGPTDTNGTAPSCSPKRDSESIIKAKPVKRTMMMRLSQVRDIVMARPAAHQAPNKLPARRFKATSQCVFNSAAGIAFMRKISAAATTTRLMALLKITASNVGSEKTPTRTGNLNSAPPSPIKPPNAPISDPAIKPLPLRAADCIGKKCTKDCQRSGNCNFPARRALSIRCKRQSNSGLSRRAYRVMHLNPDNIVPIVLTEHREFWRVHIHCKVARESRD